ncbi:flagellar basal body L-ring protein FlgH [Mesorhizobium sp. M1066]|jgi:flagellar L-ring protein precursor FlgH|uniref:flagellar basal body L-ring protein FlgH n=1 Tax=unclassified Mesorhizobium TaxID=325217 RepID=UPI000FCB4422|nr:MULTISPECIES: flagellar basal body L-ring protein FlgH [unclassified Mesorhizobium]RUV12906.1 flagellar basal body L-ring protein FlgH [Mesorhizobium sp. M7A.T.Ca.TU.009.01.3.1]MCQ8870756.1 flagellar basal body L-ring protein FlgH [Mesorhizobium sp. LMG17149]RUX31482.1 flagellar basal body L-ring protein FlgH [Mesorhizobium sp. M7A.F.Ca.US.011.01.1.1]RUZ81151.1 flagellar basal body L-ring protein FlgH [Mesorhizobium sp. M7A.F.Ca.US.006.01.1.1]RWN21245.1 MAG: flagellar basal body L-ring prot
MIRKMLVLCAVTVLSGCGTNLKEVGREPALSPVGSGIDGGSTGSLYRYPQTPPAPVKKFSLWDDRQSRLFTDPRALSQGDILTVKIKINDRANFKNQNDRSRTANRKLGYDLSAQWDKWSTAGKGAGALSSTTDTTADGEIKRSETLELNVAAIVTDVLPNGNLMITGSQEVRVNAELRVLTLAGIVRPADIGAENTIPYERIAEARISYGGRGRITEVQQPAYGQQILDQVLPF